MVRTTDPDDLAVRYRAQVQAGDMHGAVATARILLERRGSIDAVVDVMAAAQEEVGNRWERGEWTVAHEHVATAIADAALASVAASVDQPVRFDPVVVVCAEGEWHSMPALMVAAQLGDRGWSPVFLGASVPADDVGRYAGEAFPVAVLVSCSMSSFLPGVARTIEAVHAYGVPVIAGGRGLGNSPLRAQALGADGWAPDAAAADALLESWKRDGPPAPPDPEWEPLGMAVYRRLAAGRDEIVDRALERAGFDGQESSAAQGDLAGARADLHELATYVEAGVLVDDAGVLREAVAWLVRLRQGHPREHVLDLGVLVTAFVEALDTTPRARRWLWEAADSVGLGP